MALSGCIGGGSEKGPQTINLGFIVGVPDDPLFVAMDRGLYEQEGLNMTYTTFFGGNRMIEGALAGGVDGGSANVNSLIMAIDQGAPITMVALVLYADDDQSCTDDTVVLADSGINSLEDLKGKSVAVTQLSGLGHMFLQAELKKRGVDPSEITFLTVPFPKQMDALISGEIDAASTVEPFSSLTEQKGYELKRLYCSYEHYGRVDYMAIFFRNDFIEENPDAVRAFLKAHARAVEISAADPEYAMGLVAEHTHTPIEIVQQVGLEKKPDGLKFDRESLDTLMGIMVEVGYLDAPVAYEKIIDESFLPEE